jgi:hypothetical protein
LNGIGFLVVLGMAFISWMAYSQEDVRWGLPTAVIMLVLALLWLFALAASPQLVQFGQDHLIIRRWLGTVTLLYRDISAVRQSRPFITLTTPDQTVRLYKLYANTDAQLMTALEKFVPAANAVQEKRLYPKLPFTFHSASTGAVGTFVGMFLLLGGGTASFAYLITEPESIESLQWLCIPIFGLMSTGFGLMFLYMLVREFPRKYRFSPSEISLHYLFHSVRHPVQGLQAVNVKEDPRKVRGVPRTVYQLEFLYADGSVITLEPNGFGFPMDYIDAREAQITAELAAQIRHAYQLSPQKPPAAEPKSAPPPQPVGESPMSAPLAPPSPAHALIEEIRRMPIDDYIEAYETLRDELIALGPGAMPAVLNTARNNSSHLMIDLLVTVLADLAYPPAMPMMVEWLNHPQEEVRFVAAFALDNLAGGRFNVEGMIVGGWVEHDQIQAIVPQMREWYHNEGHQRVPSLTEWLARRAASSPITYQEKQYNFIESNPHWVMLGNGDVFQPEPDYKLPPHQGVHVVGGMVQLGSGSKTRSAVFEMDSEHRIVRKVVVKEDGRWLDVGHHLTSMIPHFQFE